LAIKRANGTGAWAILHSADWSTVIRPDGDEVGVFIRRDSLDLPYQPVAKSGVTNPGASMLLRPVVRALLSITGKPDILYDFRYNNHNPIIVLSLLGLGWRKRSCI
jgi:hypothetical protein